MRLFTVVLALLTTLVLGGCNTVRGIGQDIEKVGSTIEKAAQ